MARVRQSIFSRTGIVVAAVLVAGVVAWILIDGLAPFSAGPLNASAKGAPLGGVTNHAQLADDCGACHSAPWSSQTMDDRCVACHTDVAKEIKSGGIHASFMRTTPECAGCHPDHNGPNAMLTTVDHDLFPFKLTGAHAKVPCADCHAGAKTLADFKSAPRDCYSCHAKQDEHNGAFGKDCGSCHNTSGWGDADFDHNQFPFKLTGAHAKVPCKGCHADAKTLADHRNAPQDCYSCHAKDDEHKGDFGKQCGDCHSTDNWGDATFEHSVFPLDHGSEEQKATCKTCHPSKTSSYTCYGCHVHTESNVLAQHEGKSLAELADCIECHPGGREADEGGD